MNRKEFNVLTYLEQTKESQTQRSVANGISVSLGTVNKILASLRAQNLITKSLELTNEGYEALEPYRAKRIIFLAAGLGSRLLPITLNTPKPLVRVHGTRIIDTAIDAAIAAGVEEIYIVRGYLYELFDQLLYKYPQIKFLNNEVYNETNNISSAMCARHLFQNAYIMEADLLINNKNVIRKYNYTSNCLGVPVERTDDWCVISSNGLADDLRLGGMNCHHLFSIYYWNSEDGIKLAKHVEELYNMPGGKENFWDMAPMHYFNKDYRIEVIDCKFEDISEIDNLRELQELDKIYCI